MHTPDGNVVWAVEDMESWSGKPQGLHYYDGTQWTFQQPVESHRNAIGDPYPINAVWAASATNAWAVGDGGGIAHWDGVKWEYVEPTYPNEDYVKPFVIVPMTKDHWFARSATNENGEIIGHWEHKNGQWNLRTDVKGDRFDGTGPDNFWMSGELGKLYKWDNGNWQLIPFTINGIPKFASWLSSPYPGVLGGIAQDTVDGSDMNEVVFFLEPGNVVREIPYPKENGEKIDIAFIEVVGPEEFWALVQEGVYHYYRDFWWRRLRAPVTDLDSSAPDNVWMSYDGGLLHWDGFTLKNLTSEFYFGNIEVVGYNHIYTNVGAEVYRFNGFNDFVLVANRGGMKRYKDGRLFRGRDSGYCRGGGYERMVSPRKPAKIDIGGWMTTDLRVGQPGVLSFVGLATVQNHLFLSCVDLWPTYSLELYYQGLPTGLRPTITTGWNQSPSEPYALDIPLTPGAPLEPTIFDVYPMSSHSGTLGNPWPYLHVRE